MTQVSTLEAENAASTASDETETTAAPAASAALAFYDPDATVLRVPTNIPGLWLDFEQGQERLTAKQLHMLSPIGIEADWDPMQVGIFLMQAARRGLDPWAKQVYLLRIDGKYVHHIGIHGLLGKAEATGNYRGTVGPQWCGPDGVWRDVWLDRHTPPAAARVGILRAGFSTPVWGVATYDEYAPIIDEYKWDDDPSGATWPNGNPKRVKKSTGRRRPMANWACAADGGKPGVMLEKAAKARGLRDAFPEDCSGYYVGEETQKMRADERNRAAAESDDVVDAEVVLDEAGADEARQAAYKEAMSQAEPGDAYAGSPSMTGEQARELLLAEMDEQARILGKTRGEVTARWSASRGGAGPEQWDVRALASAVTALRRYTLDALRGQAKTMREAAAALGDTEQAGQLEATAEQREATANRYQTAPHIGTVEELFGYPASVLTGEVVDA